ncbi:MAG: cyanophycin synthetase [Candidatus Gottesmanbacteria bacterium]
MKNVIFLSILRWAAKRKLARLHPKIIAVTGSVGKSTFLTLLEGIIYEKFKTRTTKKGNSETGLPLEILGIRDELTDYRIITWIRVVLHAIVIGTFGDNDSYEVLIAEFGIDSPYPPKNMSYLLTLIPHPDIAVVLSVAPVHTEQFSVGLSPSDRNDESVILERIAKEKMLLAHAVTKNGTAIIQADSPLLMREVPHITGSVITVGNKSDATFHIKEMNATIKNGSSITFSHDKNEYHIIFPCIVLFPEAASTIVSVIAAASVLNLPIKTSIDTIQSISRLPPGRFSILKGIKNTTIIDSSYNASPDSVKAALLFLKTANQKKGRRIAVLGDMRELGPIAKQKHEEIARVASEVADHIVCVGEMMRKYFVPELLRVGFDEKHINTFETADGVGIFIASSVRSDDIILVKGSQNTIFLETAVKELLKNKTDEHLLCRQSSYWESVRKEFFSSHPNNHYDAKTHS